ncbi:hypothetical protein GC177_05975 [bacterium]|nr:hypothetical protein [bacterium]
MKTLVLCLMLLILPQAVQAAEATASKSFKHVMPLYEHFVVVPMSADWPMTSAFQKKDSAFFIAEFVPRKQTIDQWSEMISITAYPTSPTATANEYFAKLNSILTNLCGAENTNAKTLKNGQDEMVAMLACGRLKDSASGFGGLGKGQGELTLYRILKTEKGLVSIFYSWRGDGFDVKNETHYPVSQNVIGKARVALDEIMLCDIKKPKGDCSTYVKFVE